MESRTCNTCGITQSINNYSKKQAACKSCINKKKKELRSQSKEHQPVNKNPLEPSMMFLQRKISLLNNLFIKSMPEMETLEEHMLDLFDAYSQLKSKQISFYFPHEISENTKKCLRPALKNGMTVDSFRNTIVNRDVHTIVEILKLDLKETMECYEELTELYDLMNAVKMGYFCIDKYAKYNLRAAGSIQKSEELFVRVIYDIDASMIVLKENPYELTVEQFIREVRGIVTEFEEIIVVQYEKLGIYDKLLAIGMNSIVKPASDE